MSNTVLGNKQEYTFYQDYHEVELDDDEWIELEGELVDGESIVGFRDVCPEASESTTVQIGFYYKPPDSEWYWDYEYGQPYKPIVPVVFSVASNGNLIECLNQSFTEVALELLEEDWIVMNVTLKRKLIQNENIFFGVYSDCVGVTGIDFADADSTWSFYYFSFARRNDYNSAIAYVSSQAFIAQSRKMDCDYCPIIYLEYVNGENGSAYTRTILGNVRAAAVNANRILFLRSLANTGTLTAAALRALEIKITKNDLLSTSDFVSRLLFMIRNCFSVGVLTEQKNHKADYRKNETGIIGQTDEAGRRLNCHRNNNDDVDFVVNHHFSIFFCRTIQTVLSLWDWIRGKIREANNVVTLFCPVDLEVELECKL